MLTSAFKANVIVWVNSENKRNSWMGFVYNYGVLWILRALWIILSKTINILRKLQKKNFWDAPDIFNMFMYIAPSSGKPLPDLNLPFKWILRRFEVVFWCRAWECYFLKDWWKFIQIHQYFTIMALRQWVITSEGLFYELVFTAVDQTF